jgi:hypothetical protein
MKKSILFCVIIFTILSCSETKKEDKKENNVSTENFNKTMEMFNEIQLDINKEQIEILSVASQIQKDTLKKIIKEYLSAINETDYDKRKKINYTQIIDSISAKYKIDKANLAETLYNYKYTNKNEN